MLIPHQGGNLRWGSDPGIAEVQHADSMRKRISLDVMQVSYHSPHRVLEPFFLAILLCLVTCCSGARRGQTLAVAGVVRFRGSMIMARTRALRSLPAKKQNGLLGLQVVRGTNKVVLRWLGSIHADGQIATVSWMTHISRVSAHRSGRIYICAMYSLYVIPTAQSLSFQLCDLVQISRSEEPPLNQMDV
jgi:hypothetical protein